MPDPKFKLSFEKPDGKKSGVGFRMPAEHAEDPDVFMLYVGTAMVALYRHEYEKLFGHPPMTGLFRPRFEVPEEIRSDAQVIEAIKMSEEASRRSGNALYDWVHDRIAKDKAKKEG